MNVSTTSKNLLLLFVLIQVISHPVWGQCEPNGADNGDQLRIAHVEFPEIPGQYQFTVCGKPQLDVIDKFAGYRYFWDFGDGTYSFQEEPHHQYLTTGNFRPKVHLVKAYTSSKNGLNLLRTGAPSGGSIGEELIISPASIAPGASYSDLDGYQPPSLAPASNIDLIPAFDLVPGYLETFVLSLKNDCATPGNRDVWVTFPHGLFSTDAAALFENPDNPAETSSPFIPANNPPSLFEMAGPIVGDHTTAEGPAFGELDTLKLTVNLPGNTTDLVHVVIHLYASPYLPIGEDINFGVRMLSCGNSTTRAAGNEMQKGVPVTSSHDPNYKFVDDEKIAEDKLIYISGNQPSKLVFRLAFQNEGNASERFVSVFDTLAEELDFNTLKLLNITLADTNTPKSICDYPPIWRDYVWDNPSDPTHYYKMTKNPATRVVSWDFRTSLMGMQMINPITNDTIPEEWSWGYIDFEIYTKCGLPDQIEFSNRAGIVFEGQDPVITDEVHIRRVCFDNRTFVYTGPGFDLDVVNIAQRLYPNANFDPRTTVITHSRAGLRYPATIDTTRGSEYRYLPDTTRYRLLDTVSIVNQRVKERVLVDNLRYTICDRRANRCYPISIFVLINPDGRDSIPEYECEGACDPMPPVEDPYPLWWYWLAGIILFLLIILSAFRRGRRRGRRR